MQHIEAGPFIVVGVDGSAASVAALRWAAREAELRHAELRAIYAWDAAQRYRAPYAATGGVSNLDVARAAATSLLEASVRAALGRTRQAALRTELAEGRAERVLLDRAAGAELLVLGSTGQPDQLLQVPGPVHRACLRGAPCPVVVVGCAEGAVTHEPASKGRPHVAAGAAAQN